MKRNTLVTLKQKGNEVDIMGQRSQIYVKLDCEDKNGNTQSALVARYFQWNYGERMISRAAGLVEWLKDHEYLGITYEDREKIARIAEINFDFRDVVLSSDITKEAKDWTFSENESLNDFIFSEQDNNDGQLFINIQIPYHAFGDERKPPVIKIAFADMDKHKVMTADEYLDWDLFVKDEDGVENWRDYMKKSEYYDDETIAYTEKNISFLNENAKMMTNEELRAFIEADYEKILNLSPHAINKSHTVEGKLAEVYDKLDDIQEMDEVQKNEDLMHEVGEAIGAVGNALDEFMLDKETVERD